MRKKDRQTNRPKLYKIDRQILSDNILLYDKAISTDTDEPDELLVNVSERKERKEMTRIIRAISRF